MLVESDDRDVAVRGQPVLFEAGQDELHHLELVDRAALAQRLPHQRVGRVLGLQDQVTGQAMAVEARGVGHRLELLDEIGRRDDLDSHRAHQLF